MMLYSLKILAEKSAFSKRRPFTMHHGKPRRHPDIAAHEKLRYIKNKH